jgi:hypothetical protein
MIASAEQSSLQLHECSLDHDTSGVDPSGPTIAVGWLAQDPAAGVFVQILPHAISVARLDASPASDLKKAPATAPLLLQRLSIFGNKGLGLDAETGEFLVDADVLGGCVVVRSSQGRVVVLRFQGGAGDGRLREVARRDAGTGASPLGALPLLSVSIFLGDLSACVAAASRLEPVTKPSAAAVQTSRESEDDWWGHIEQALYGSLRPKDAGPFGRVDKKSGVRAKGPRKRAGSEPVSSRKKPQIDPQATVAAAEAAAAAAASLATLEKLVVSKLKVTELRTELSARGLETTGLKAELSKRLTAAVEKEKTRLESETAAAAMVRDEVASGDGGEMETYDMKEEAEEEEEEEEDYEEEEDDDEDDNDANVIGTSSANYRTGALAPVRPTSQKEETYLVLLDSAAVVTVLQMPGLMPVLYISSLEGLPHALPAHLTAPSLPTPQSTSSGDDAQPPGLAQVVDIRLAPVGSTVPGAPVRLALAVMTAGHSLTVYAANQSAAGEVFGFSKIPLDVPTASSTVSNAQLLQKPELAGSVNLPSPSFFSRVDDLGGHRGLLVNAEQSVFLSATAGYPWASAVSFPELPHQRATQVGLFRVLSKRVLTRILGLLALPTRSTFLFCSISTQSRFTSLSNTPA